MRIDGIQLREGSSVTNLTVASGADFPASPTTGELFFRTSTDTSIEGLYIFHDETDGWKKASASIAEQFVADAEAAAAAAATSETNAATSATTASNAAAEFAAATKVTSVNGRSDAVTLSGSDVGTDPAFTGNITSTGSYTANGGVIRSTHPTTAAAVVMRAVDGMARRVVGERPNGNPLWNLILGDYDQHFRLYRYNDALGATQSLQIDRISGALNILGNVTINPGEGNAESLRIGTIAQGLGLWQSVANDPAIFFGSQSKLRFGTVTGVGAENFVEKMSLDYTGALNLKMTNMVYRISESAGNLYHDNLTPSMVDWVPMIERASSFMWSIGTGTQMTYTAAGGLSAPTAIFADRFATGYDSGLSGSMNCSNWYRSLGDTGWFSVTYGGGIYMTDTTFVRVYANKGLHVGNGIVSEVNSAASFPSVLLRNRTPSATSHTYGALMWDAYRDVSDPSYVGAITCDGANSAGNGVVMNFRLQENATNTLPGGKAYLDASGNFRAFSVAGTSDSRVKTDIVQLQDSLTKLTALVGVSFKYIETNGEGIGLIAQDVREQFPQVVLESPDEQKILGVNYGGLMGPVVEALKEIKQRLEALEAAVYK